MSENLAWLQRDAQKMKDQLRNDRLTIGLTDVGFAHAMTGIAMVLQALKGATPNVTAAGAQLQSEYFDWPNREMACPKCGRHKRRFLDYCPATNTAPERMRHSCFCGYHLFTKPLDASPDALMSRDDDTDV